MRHSLLLAALALHSAFAHAAPDAAGAREVHGVADAFARPGVALAWGILRGKSEVDTTVVVRVETTDPDFAFVVADGIDPFTQQRKAIQAPVRTSPRADLRFPRAHFADFPRTEFKFAADGKAASPALTIYYLGVPDTTPEFATQEALGRYLDDRLARERATTGATPK
jgi:hypothetical protein